MTALQKIPATIVTGFLGAGKTTLITKMIEKANGKRLALIVNEFGDLGFDGGQIAACGVPGCEDDDVIELTNGCICCTVADDFVPAMEQLLARDPAPDHIIIETSGLALPQPLVQAFQWPAVKDRVTVDGVVTVTDAAALAEGRIANDVDAVQAQRAADPALDHEDPVEELFEDQIRCADLIVLSKADLVAADARQSVAERIRSDARESVEIVEAAHGDLALSVLLGIGAGAEDDLDSRREHHHHDGEDHDHDHDDFDSFVVAVPEAGSLSVLKAAVERVMAVEGVLRAKGTATIAGKAPPAVVQAVGPRVDAYFAAANSGDRSRLVVIGLASMNRAAVEAALQG